MVNQTEQSIQERLIELVTGANQGIGREIAKALSANGYIVLVGSRNITKGQVAAQSIGSNAYPIQLDARLRKRQNEWGTSLGNWIY